MCVLIILLEESGCIDVADLIRKATAPFVRCIKFVSAESLYIEYFNIFKDALGLLKDIEAKIMIDQAATPKFHHHCPVPFCFKRESGNSPISTSL